MNTQNEDIFTDQDIKRAGIEVDLASGPQFPSRWQKHWDGRFGKSIRYPDKTKMTQWVAQSITGAPARLRKGPLQLLLENWWPTLLRETR